MVNLPELMVKKDNVTVINSFLGINKGLHIQESEFEDMANMTNDYYPVISNRKKRGIMQKLELPLGIYGGEALIYITGEFDESGIETDFLYIDDQKINKVALDEKYVGKERQIVKQGAYICIFPDGIVYNTSDEDVSSIENITQSSTTVEMRMCKLDGTDFDSNNTYIGKTAPEDTETYIYWLDTSKENQVILKMWSETYSMWTSVATTYVKISSEGIGKGFREYDSVKISGIRIKGYNDYNFNDRLIVYACDDDYIVVAGLMDLYYTQEAQITLERTLPELDYVCELDNRIWGCSSKNHEIYASKQGSPWNWYSYAGLDSDSYAATVGTQGNFTGACAFLGYVYFFKEDGFHKLYGNKPSNFEMVWKPCRGVQEGCSKSIAYVNEYLIFKARDAIVVYNGSEDTISDNLGIEPFYDAVGVGYRNKYYVSMRDVDYNYKIYVFDITKGTWCIEDNKRLLFATYANNGTYIIDSDYQIYVINNEKIFKKWFPNEVDLGDEYMYPSMDLFAGNIISGDLEDHIEWSLTTGDLGLDNPYNKYLKRINLRMQLDVATKLKIEIEYDSSGEWEYVTEYYATKKKSYEIPIVVKRADHVRMRLSGWGDFKLYTIAKAVEAGSGENEGGGS